MNLLEDRLNNAAEEARQQIARVASRPATSIQSRQQHHRVLIGAVAAAAVFALFGATAMVMSSSTGLDAASEPTVPPTTVAPVEVSDVAPAIIVPAATDITHLVGKVSASSELSSEFGADRLIDGDLGRGWQDASLQGVGAWFELRFTDPVAIDEIIITPLAGDAGFARNFKVNQYTIEMNDKADLVTGRMPNEPRPQTIAVDSTQTMYLRFTVNSTHPAVAAGDDPPYDELVIAEIQILGATVATPELPRLGVGSDDWSVIEAVDVGTGTTLIYEGNPAVYGGEPGEARLNIQIWSDRVGEDPGTGYRHALAALKAKENPLADTRLPDGTVARTFTYADPNGGNLGYYFLWQHSDTVAVEVIVFLRQENQSREVVAAIERLSEPRWGEILDSQQEDATGATTPTTVAPSGVGDAESSISTTTVIVAEPQLPPALRGTPLTKAWGEYVVETMVMAGYEAMDGYEIADMDVFEKEMDRGLVHATFTVDGDEWALAFGPWRDGEYSDDPAVLQDQFFSQKPGLETAEGLLLISDRSDPSYVYLAMDVGKIAISFQPDVVGAAVPFEDLEALAVRLAPIVRLLLEADLIEWNA